MPNGSLSIFFSAARASGTFVDPEQEQQLGIFTQSFSASFLFYTKLLSFILFFSAIRRHSSVLQFRGPTQTRTGICFFSTATETRVRLLSTIYSNTDSGEFVVGLSVRLFVCLFVQVCLFLCFFVFYSTATETRVRLLSTIFIYYSLQERICFSVEWSPWRAWRPTTPRRS